MLKEVGSGLYSMSTYFISHMLAELPGCILPSILNAALVYFATGLDLSLPHFGLFGTFLLI